ncbi:hypothetical protein [Streptomyces sp. NPDC102487]|uniref:hypothetical protein n=1 Tax=Streptomyces sp. NPDC102487 TaxID=3366182 RepID=UPI00381F61CD
MSASSARTQSLRHFAKAAVEISEYAAPAPGRTLTTRHLDWANAGSGGYSRTTKWSP